MGKGLYLQTRHGSGRASPGGLYHLAGPIILPSTSPSGLFQLGKIILSASKPVLISPRSNQLGPGLTSPGGLYRRPELTRPAAKGSVLASPGSMKPVLVGPGGSYQLGKTILPQNQFFSLSVSLSHTHTLTQTHTHTVRPLETKVTRR